ncbi:MAG: hypothetical protein TECD_00588 [Hyphomicrobiaceae bacterium hypho_1]
MCLGIPGKIIAINDANLLMATVDISGVTREVNISCVASKPLEKLIGSYALIHVGFAMALIDEHEANRTLEILKNFGMASEMLQGTQNVNLADKHQEDLGEHHEIR